MIINCLYWSSLDCCVLQLQSDHLWGQIQALDELSIIVVWVNRIDIFFPFIPGSYELQTLIVLQTLKAICAYLVLFSLWLFHFLTFCYCLDCIFLPTPSLLSLCLLIFLPLIFRLSLVMVQKPVSDVMVPCCLLHQQLVPYLPHPPPPSR